jgi:hypothetical protein
MSREVGNISSEWLADAEKKVFRSGQSCTLLPDLRMVLTIVDILEKTESLVVDGMGDTKLEWLEATPPNHYLTMLKGL